MDPTDGRYGWAPDDPRWLDAQAGGRGRLEPSPPPLPSFDDADTVVGGLPPVPHYPTPHEDVPYAAPWGAPPAPLIPPSPPANGAGVRTGYGLSAAGVPAPPTPSPPTPPLAAPPPPAPPLPERARPERARPERALPDRLALDRSLPVVPRVERHGPGRARRRDDEFRLAGRAELFSDDARYVVLYSLVGLWYTPVVVLFLAWVLVVGAGDGPVGPRVLAGLSWLATAVVLSLVVVGLLRWARVGWRALTLSAGAALIGGGVATIAHTLSG